MIDMLEFEIGHVRSEESKPGWSKWALMGGIATTVWLLTQELEQNRVIGRRILFLFLSFSLAYEAVKQVSSVIFKVLPAQAKGRFVVASSRFSHGRQLMLFEMVRYLSLLVIAWRVAEGFMSRPYRLVTIVFFGFNALLVGMVFVISFVSFPIPEPSPEPRIINRAVRGILLISGLSATIVSVSWLLNDSLSFTIPEYRIGGLLFVISLILLLLAKGQPQTPLLETLVGIRRSLGLGQLDFDSARRQVEIALQGMTVSDVLQNDLVRLLAEWERGGIHLETASKELEAFSQTFKAESSQTHEGVKLLCLVLDSIDKHADETRKALDLVDPQLIKLKQRMALYERLSPTSKTSLALLQKRLEEAFEGFTSKNKAFQTRLAELKARVSPVDFGSQPMQTPEAVVSPTTNLKLTSS